MLADRLSELRSHLVTVEHGEQGAAVEVHDLDLQSQVKKTSYPSSYLLMSARHISTHLKTPYKRN